MDPAHQVLLATLQAQFMAQQEQQQTNARSSANGSGGSVSPVAVQTFKGKPFPLLPFAQSTRSTLTQRLEHIDQLVKKDAADVIAECSRMEFGKLTSEQLKLNLLNDNGLPPYPPAAPTPSVPKKDLNPTTPSVFVSEKINPQLIDKVFFRFC